MSTNDAIARLDVAVSALVDVDVATWPDNVLSGHLHQLSAMLCQVDAQLARLADTVRARGFDVEEAFAGAVSPRVRADRAGADLAVAGQSAASDRT